MDHTRILCLETALSGCSVCLAEDRRLLAEAVSDVPNSASDKLHLLVKQVLETSGLQLKDLDAIAVSIGPGSYTGLRIGLAAAKGYAYALSVPVIPVSTLKAMAWAAKFRHGLSGDRYAPAIDARRNEIFWAVYDQNLDTLIAESPMVVSEKSLEHFDPALRYIMPGNGAHKLTGALALENLYPTGVNTCLASDMTELAFNDMEAGPSADTAYLEPNYTKGFHFV